MHEPPTNKEIRATNEEKQKDWDHLNIALSDYNKGHCSHPPVDAKGKVLSKICRAAEAIQLYDGQSRESTGCKRKTD
jgi:hypothetical protein